MSEINHSPFDDQVRESHEPRPDRAVYEPTGNRMVDDVLETLEGLEDAPMSEHVAVFESAHESLRAALADAGNEASAS